MALRSVLVLAVAAGLLATAASALRHSAGPLRSEPSAIGAFPPIWPHPASFHNGTSVAVIDAPALKYIATGAQSPLLDAAWSRFFARTFQHQTTSPPRAPPKASPAVGEAIALVSINVQNVSAALQLYMDESYTLTVTTSVITITAATLFGAYHALETLSQLIAFDYDFARFDIHHAPWTITDAPRFPHRGLLIDSSRHFLPLRTIKTIIDSATYAKLNAIHWHIVDAIAFPFDSPTYPQLGRLGSFSSRERYTVADVAEIVAYARERGVRVEVELDTPGHSASMCAGIPQICPVPGCASANVNNWALDITKNMTYEVVGKLFEELAAIFPETLMHIGGDEVVYSCWAAHPYIMQWLAERNLSLTGGYEYYIKRVQAMVWALQREVVGWQEIWDHFGTALNKKTIIQQWLPNSVALPLNVTSHGYRLIWSDSSVWYLDHLAVTWQQMYLAEPCNGLPDANCELILGGEGCQWGETVDASDALQTIWPRAAAIAERLWSPRPPAAAAASVPAQVVNRITAFRCLLNERGIAAAPVRNPTARSAPPGPGSCYRQ